jgi:hypothetical protein
LKVDELSLTPPLHMCTRIYIYIYSIQISFLALLSFVFFLSSGNVDVRRPEPTADVNKKRGVKLRDK